MNKRFYITTFTSLFFYILSLFIAKNDLLFSYRWVSFSFWFISLLIPLGYVLLKENCLGAIRNFFSKEELTQLSFILVLSLFTSFLFLKTYPFVAVMDEVRDGGWNARQIYNGTLKNIWGYGRYESHGLIIPTLTVPFYAIFKESVLSYRVPAALVSVFDILIIYFFARKVLGRQGALLSSIILANLPLHLYYARTEIVIIFSSFLTSLIILFSYMLYKAKSIQYYMALGLLLGFSSGFHASIRTIVLATLAFMFIFSFYRLFKEKNKYGIVFGFLGLIIFFFVGFGPRMLFTTPNVFFHFRTVAVLKKDNAEWGDTNISLRNLIKNYPGLQTNYLKSFRAYINLPVYMHFQDQKPILPKILSAFFIIGIFAAIFLTKNLFWTFLIYLTFLIPLTNSAITDCVNCDNRLLPALPVCAMITSLGIDAVVKTVALSRKKLGNILIVVLIAYISLQSFLFFLNESASKGKNFQDYLSMYVVYLLKSLPRQRSVCLAVSPKNHQFFNLLHIKEQHDFLLPNTNIEKKIDSTIPENIVYITKDCNIYNSSFLSFEYCFKKDKFICPQDYERGFEIYVDRTLVR